MAGTQRIGDLPANAHQKNFRWELCAFEIHCHRLAPFVHRKIERTIIPQRDSIENCDRTHFNSLFLVIESEDWEEF